MRVKKLMLATDFSESSKAALKMATTMRDQFAGHLDVLHAFDPKGLEYAAGHYLMPTMGSWLSERVASLHGLAEKTLAELCDKLGPCSRHLVEGPPGDMIVRFAREHAIDMIIMGTHGHEGLKRLVMGSVAEQVVRHAPCAVLIIKPDVDEAEEQT